MHNSTSTAHSRPSVGGAPLTTHALIEVSAVSKSFIRPGSRRSTIALSDVTLAVEEGTFVCLLGPSGCGKSTLLNLLAGFLFPDGGTICAAGSPIIGPSPQRGVVFQQPALFPWLTVRDNVLFGPKAQHKITSETRDQAMRILTVVGLEAFADHLPQELSGGMKQRLAIARVLINDPQVLLMDEPFGALDAITRATMQEFLLTLWEQQRTTIVFVTHDVEEAVLLGDRIVIMSPRPGRIADVVDVHLSRPRSYAHIDTDEYAHVRRTVRARLEQVV